MNAVLSFIVNILNSIAVFVYTDPVCSIGLIAIAFNLVCVLLIHVKKLL